jgi:hypothetical protein
MEQEAVLAEMQALLASLKSTLSDEGLGQRGPAADARSGASAIENPSRQLACDLLPDNRALRRFLLMV